jgi:hypothetical protein
VGALAALVVLEVLGFQHVARALVGLGLELFVALALEFLLVLIFGFDLTRAVWSAGPTLVGTNFGRFSLTLVRTGWR